MLPSSWRSKSGKPPGSSVERTLAGLTHTIMSLSEYNISMGNILAHYTDFANIRIRDKIMKNHKTKDKNHD
jgi:hypothetical protein